MFLFRRCVPAFRVDLIDVPLVIRRGRDIEFRSWARVTLEGPVVLRVACGRVGRRRGATGRTHGRFRPRVESHALLRDVHVLQLFGGFLKEIDFYLFTPFEPPFRGGTVRRKFGVYFLSGNILYRTFQVRTFSKHVLTLSVWNFWYLENLVGNDGFSMKELRKERNLPLDSFDFMDDILEILEERTRMSEKRKIMNI